MSNSQRNSTSRPYSIPEEPLPAPLPAIPPPVGTLPPPPSAGNPAKELIGKVPRPSLETPLTPNSYLSKMMGDLHSMYQQAQTALKQEDASLDDIYGLYSDPKEETMCRNRAKAVQEIVVTESTYVEMMTVLLDLVVDPLREQAKVSKKMPNNELHVIFGNIERILSVHQVLLTGLQERYLMWTENQVISDVLLGALSLFNVYESYMANYIAGQEALRRSLKQYPDFQKFVDRVQQHPKLKGQQLQSLLVLPIQRIPRYIMLIQQLLNFTTKDHPDYKGLEKFFVEMKKFADDINEKIREKEARAKVTFIESKMHGRPSNFGQIQNASRYFVAEMEVHKPGNPLSKRTVFLLNDLAILVKKQTDKFEYKDEMQLSQKCWVRVEETTEFVFHLVSQDKHWSLVASTLEDREKFCSQIGDVISERPSRLSSLSLQSLSPRPKSENRRSASQLSTSSQERQRLSAPPPRRESINHK